MAKNKRIRVKKSSPRRVKVRRAKPQPVKRIKLRHRKPPKPPKPARRIRLKKTPRRRVRVKRLPAPKTKPRRKIRVHGIGKRIGRKIGKRIGKRLKKIRKQREPREERLEDIEEAIEEAEEEKKKLGRPQAWMVHWIYKKTKRNVGFVIVAFTAEEAIKYSRDELEKTKEGRRVILKFEKPKAYQYDPPRYRNINDLGDIEER